MFSSLYAPQHDAVNLISFVFPCFSVIFAASVSIHLQPFHRARRLVGLLCGVMVTRRPRASRTSKYNLINDETTSAAALVRRSFTNPSLLRARIVRAVCDSNEGNVKAGLVENRDRVHAHARRSLFFELPIQHSEVDSDGESSITRGLQSKESCSTLLP